MQKQLKSLNSLSLAVQQQGWAGAERVWQALGRFTQLTALLIQFDSEETAGCTGKDLEALRGLHQLRSLGIGGVSNGTVAGRTEPLLTQQLLQPLTLLTSLDCDACTLNEMVCVGSCPSLQRLKVACGDEGKMEMSDAHWHAVGKLSQLTLLTLHNAVVLSAPPACFAALRRLQKLQHFGAWVMSKPLLPALAACTQLTLVRGAWQRTSDPGSGRCGVDMCAGRVVLPSVVELDLTSGAIPFAAFPNLHKLSHDSTVELSSLHALASCCTKLRTLLFCLNACASPSDMLCSLAFDEPTSARVACLQSFTRLHHLRGLSLSLNDDAELIALASVVCVLTDMQLDVLSIVLPAETDVTVCGLSQLARVRGIRLLVLAVLCDVLVSTENDAFMVLCALWGVKFVLVQLATPLQKQLMDAAWAQLVGSGLARPRRVITRMSPA